MEKETFGESFKNLFLDNLTYILGVFIIFIIIFCLYYYFVNHSNPLVSEFEKFDKFKHSHIQPKPMLNWGIDATKNSHFILYGCSGSGKTSFLKWYLSFNKIEKFTVFGRDSREWSSKVIVNVLDFDKIKIENLQYQTVILDDAGAHKKLNPHVEDIFRLGRHENIQAIYLAHYAKDVLPVVRENTNTIYITLNNQDLFFETIIKTYTLREPGLLKKWQEYRNSNQFGVIQLDTRTQKYIILNKQYEIIYDSSEEKTDDPALFTERASYFFTGEVYEILKLFLERQSDQEIEITTENVAFYYVVYCLQNGIKVNTSKLSNYFDRLGSPEVEMAKKIGTDLFESAVKSQNK